MHYTHIYIHNQKEDSYNNRRQLKCSRGKYCEEKFNRFEFIKTFYIQNEQSIYIVVLFCHLPTTVNEQGEDGHMSGMRDM